MSLGQPSRWTIDTVESHPRAHWISASEAIVGSLIVVGYNVLHVLPNSVFLLVAMALISFRWREGNWRAMGLGLPKSWTRTALIAAAVAVLQQSIGQFVIDPLTHSFLHYSTQANPLKNQDAASMALRWLGIIWTYAAFGEEVSYRAYLLKRSRHRGLHPPCSCDRFAVVEHPVRPRPLVSRLSRSSRWCSHRTCVRTGVSPGRRKSVGAGPRTWF